jgi:hypothetical protein
MATDTVGHLASTVLVEIDKKHHKRNPFDDRYLQFSRLKIEEVLSCSREAFTDI